MLVYKLIFGVIYLIRQSRTCEVFNQSETLCDVSTCVNLPNLQAIAMPVGKSMPCNEILVINCSSIIIIKSIERIRLLGNKDSASKCFPSSITFITNGFEILNQTFEFKNLTMNQGNQTKNGNAEYLPSIAFDNAKLNVEQYFTINEAQRIQINNSIINVGTFTTTSSQLDLLSTELQFAQSAYIQGKLIIISDSNIKHTNAVFAVARSFISFNAETLSLSNTSIVSSVAQDQVQQVYTANAIEINTMEWRMDNFSINFNGTTNGNGLRFMASDLSCQNSVVLSFCQNTTLKNIYVDIPQFSLFSKQFNDNQHQSDPKTEDGQFSIVALTYNPSRCLKQSILGIREFVSISIENALIFADRIENIGRLHMKDINITACIISIKAFSIELNRVRIQAGKECKSVYGLVEFSISSNTLVMNESELSTVKFNVKLSSTNGSLIMANILSNYLKIENCRFVQFENVLIKEIDIKAKTLIVKSNLTFCVATMNLKKMTIITSMINSNRTFCEKARIPIIVTDCSLTSCLLLTSNSIVISSSFMFIESLTILSDYFLINHFIIKQDTKEYVDQSVRLQANEVMTIFSFRYEGWDATFDSKVLRMSYYIFISGPPNRINNIDILIDEELKLNKILFRFPAIDLQGSPFKLQNTMVLPGIDGFISVESETTCSLTGLHISNISATLKSTSEFNIYKQQSNLSIVHSLESQQQDCNNNQPQPF